MTEVIRPLAPTRATTRARVRAAACVARARCRPSCTAARASPRNVTLDQRNLLTMVDNEKFYSSVITLQLDGQDQQAIVKDVQMHPARNQVLHVDLQRVLADQAIRIHIPIHF